MHIANMSVMVDGHRVEVEVASKDREAAQKVLVAAAGAGDQDVVSFDERG